MRIVVNRNAGRERRQRICRQNDRVTVIIGCDGYDARAQNNVAGFMRQRTIYQGAAQCQGRGNRYQGLHAILLFSGTGGTY